MKKPKIAIICNSYPTAKNKTNQIFIKNLVDELRDQSLTPDIYYNRIYNYWGNASNNKDLISNVMKYSIFLIGISRLVTRIKSYDLLNPHGVMISGFVAILIKRFFHIPVALHIHGGDLNIYKLSNAIYKKIYDITISNSDIIIVNSNDIKNKILDLTGAKTEKVIVISPGVDYNKFRPMNYNQIQCQKKIHNIDNDKIVLLFAGNAIKRKGLDILVNALCLLREEQQKKIFLIICSDGPEINVAKNNLENIKDIKNSVKFLKKVDQSELRILYNIATIFTFPSREEPLGLVGLEAIACGTPVIGSNVGGISEYINKNNGFLFDPNHPEELAKIIGSIVDHPETIKSLINTIDKKQSEHDIKISARKLINIFSILEPNYYPKINLSKQR